ncbi:MAG: cupin domain-containing protein [Gammaproteobacteria bacterium]|nr:cupin domain-containing protein [Gammaproteobacteria bacterium]
MKTKYDEVEQFTTKDGSTIRELMHPDEHGGMNQAIKSQSVKNQSLAEATLPVGKATVLHKHKLTEELYHITSGQGLMSLDGKQFTVTVGDTICIPPGKSHCIENTGSKDLKILCCCSPAYSHEDTQLLNSESV